MSNLVDIKVPASFVVDWGFPTGAELGYGFRRGWVRGHDAVEIALAKYKADLTLAPEEEELALLFPVEFNKVEELAKGLDWSPPMNRLSGGLDSGYSSPWPGC